MPKGKSKSKGEKTGSHKPVYPGSWDCKRCGGWTGASRAQCWSCGLAKAQAQAWILSPHLQTAAVAVPAELQQHVQQEQNQLHVSQQAEAQVALLAKEELELMDEMVRICKARQSGVAKQYLAHVEDRAKQCRVAITQTHPPEEQIKTLEKVLSRRKEKTERLAEEVQRAQTRVLEAQASLQIASGTLDEEIREMGQVEAQLSKLKTEMFQQNVALPQVAAQQQLFALLSAALPPEMVQIAVGLFQTTQGVPVQPNVEPGQAQGPSEVQQSSPQQSSLPSLPVLAPGSNSTEPGCPREPLSTWLQRGRATQAFPQGRGRPDCDQQQSRGTTSVRSRSREQAPHNQPETPPTPVPRPEAADSTMSEDMPRSGFQQAPQATGA